MDAVRASRATTEDGALKGWLARPVLSVVGAMGGAAFIAVVEGSQGSVERHSPGGPTVRGDAAVLAPLATAVGIAVAVAMMTLDPHRRWTLAHVQARLRLLEDGDRSWLAALVLLAPTATLVWLLV